VMKSPIGEKELMDLTRQIYRSFMSPSFIWRKIIGIRSFSDIKFLFTAGLRVLGHLTDFS
ncbi:B12-binding domain-containing radical SAM protein, partial [bacterium]|nr:B12-binding domain-containing radical SAM protein [bacterium]